VTLALVAAVPDGLAQPPKPRKTLEDLLQSEAEILPEGVIGAPVRPYASEAITDAWQEYREAVDGASEKLLAALEAELRRAKGRGDADAQTGIEAARNEFTRRGGLPSVFASSLSTHREAARRAYAKAAADLAKAYAAVAAELADAGDRAESRAVADEWSLLNQQAELTKQPRADSTWKHTIANGQSAEITLFSGGTINAPDGPDTWKLDGKTLVIRWKNPEAPGGAWVDTCEVSPFGGSYSGKNQLGTRISAKRLP
jgi:hypothetical protein